MEPFFPFVLLGLAVGLLIWGVSNLSVEERYTKLFATSATAVGVAVLGWFFTTYGKGGLLVCSFLGTSSRRTVGLGADQSRCGAATRKNLRRDSDGPGNGPPALGDQRGSEWRTSSPALRKQHHHGSQRSDRLGSRVPHGRHRRPCALIPWENQEGRSARHSRVRAHFGITASPRIALLG